jgi:glyceraldehyde 3-phosphate dehydrogenase
VTSHLGTADYNHNPFSAVYDPAGTMVTGRRFCSVMAWYDNEWAFSLRMLDTGAVIAALGTNPVNHARPPQYSAICAQSAGAALMQDPEG